MNKVFGLPLLISIVCGLLLASFVSGQNGTAGVPVTGLPPARALYCLSTVNEISGIDGVAQTFFGDIGIICYYQEPLLNLTPAEYNYVPLSSTWLTFLETQSVLFKFDFSNKLSVTVDPATTVTFYGVGPSTPPIVATSNPSVIYPGLQWIAFYGRYSGTFKTVLNLRDFPFDTQTLYFNITSWIVYPWRAFIMANWKPNYNMIAPSAEAIVGWQIKNKWELNGTSYAVMFDVYFPTVSYAVQLERDPQYYVNKLIVGVVLLTLISNMMFFMEFDVPDRPAGNLACFLGIVTYLFIISSDVPKLPYSTRMDNFVYVSFYIVFADFVINIILHQVVAKPIKFYQTYAGIDDPGLAAQIEATALAAASEPYPSSVGGDANPLPPTASVPPPMQPQFLRPQGSVIFGADPSPMNWLRNQGSVIFATEGSTIFDPSAPRRPSIVVPLPAGTEAAPTSKPKCLQELAEMLQKWQGTVDWVLFIVSNLVYLIGVCVTLLG